MKGIIKVVKGFALGVMALFAWAGWCIVTDEECWIIAGAGHGWHYQYPEEEK